jgi:hypothetical protein
MAISKPRRPDLWRWTERLEIENGAKKFGLHLRAADEGSGGKQPNGGSHLRKLFDRSERFSKR